MRTLSDLWITHFRSDGTDLIIRHDRGELRLPLETISSHKQASLASLVIRQFSRHRHDITLTCFRPQEIADLMDLLHSVEKRNHAKKPDA